MVLLLVMIKSVLLAIKGISIDPTNVADTFLILLKGFLFLSDLCKFIHDDGADDLSYNELYNKKIDEIN